MFYSQFEKLCEKKQLTPNKALVDCNISRTSVAKWKKGATPNGTTIQKLADYFGVTTDYLLGAEAEEVSDMESKREISEKDVQVAFFRGADISDDQMNALWQDAKSYINYKISQMKDKQ